MRQVGAVAAQPRAVVDELGELAADATEPTHSRAHQPAAGADGEPAVRTGVLGRQRPLGLDQPSECELVRVVARDVRAARRVDGL